MATITKTFTENDGTGNKATWTISVTASNKTVSGNFKMGLTGTAKHVVSGKGYGSVSLNCDYNDYEESFSGYSFLDRPVDSWDNVQFVSGTTYSLTNSDEREIILSSVFNSSNATSITANITLYTTHISLNSTTNASGDGWSWYDNTNRVNWGTIATVTLNAPPQVTLGTPTYQTPYAGLGVYTVPLTTLTALYGGKIDSVELTVGAESTHQMYSAGTVSDQAISLTPSNVGTFTPRITVFDSRGQMTFITLPQITVNPYNVPSASFDVYRTNDIGIKNDEGHYALIQSTISYTDAIATLIEPSIQIDGTDLSSLTDASVTWYKTWSNTSGVSNVISDWTTLVPQNHMVTIYGLIDWDYDTTGNFAEDTSYQITLIANDSVDGHSTPITQTMSTAFYTIDFQAGGKEIAFGSPANDDLSDFNGKDYSDKGLFKCNMGTAFNDMTTQEVNDFVDGLNFTGINVTDYVVEQGIKDIWTYRKWNSGLCDLWGVYHVSGQAPYNTAVVYGYWYRHTSTIYFPFPIKNVSGSYSVLGGSAWAIAGAYFPCSDDDSPSFISSSPIFCLVSTSGSIDITYKIILHGRWK